MNMDLVLLVLPVEVQQLVGHTGTSLDKEQEVSKVVVSCELGRSLFGFAIGQCLSNQLDKVAKVAIDKLMQQEEISASDVEQSKRTLALELQALPGMNELPEKIEIQATYRGRDLRLKAGSITEQVDLMFAVASKGRAAQNCDLVNLLCEEDLVDDNSRVKNGQFYFTLCPH